MNKPIQVNDTTFEKVVLQSPLPVLVAFCAPRCSPCRTGAPVLESLAKAYAGQLLVATINADENPEWTTRYRVSEIPTLLFISEGEVIREQVGGVPLPVLQPSVDEFLEITAWPPVPMGLRLLSPFWRNPGASTPTGTANMTRRPRNGCRVTSPRLSSKRLDQPVPATR